MSTLNEEELTLINKLIDLSRKIFKLYNNLFSLETNDQKNSLEYQNQLKYLTICLEIETELFNQIDINKVHDYIDYINNDHLFPSFTDYDLLINRDNELLIKKRIYNRLNDIRNLNTIKTYQDSEIIKKDNPPFDHKSFLKYNIHDDIERLVAFLTYEKAHELENLKYKNNLIEIKYLISFLNQRIENNFSLLNDSFDYIFISFKSTADLLGVDFKSLLVLLKEYFYMNIKFYLKELANIKDIDYLDNILRVILYECIIKAYLNINPDNLDYVKALIHDIINSSEKNNTSIYILESLLDETSHKKIKILRSERLVLNESSK